MHDVSVVPTVPLQQFLPLGLHPLVIQGPLGVGGGTGTLPAQSVSNSQQCDPQVIGLAAGQLPLGGFAPQVANIGFGRIEIIPKIKKSV